jgi:hypothetical protein
MKRLDNNGTLTLIDGYQHGLWVIPSGVFGQRIVVPVDEQKALIRCTNAEFHHQGHTKAHNVLYPLHYWPGMDATIEDPQDDSSGGCEDNSLSLLIFQPNKEAQSTSPGTLSHCLFFSSIRKHNQQAQELSLTLLLTGNWKISKCEGILKSSSACTNPSSARRTPCSQVFHKTKRQP